MTSELSCFVYLQMPASLEVVTCGRFVLTPLGPGDGVGRFVYGRRYRSRPDVVPIDPIDLPIKDLTFETGNPGGVFGVLRDASPDAWGRLVIERVLGRSELNEVELLLNSPDDRAGALSFGLGQDPPAPVRDFNRILQLGELREAARVIEAGAPARQIREQAQRVLQPTTSFDMAKWSYLLLADELQRWSSRPADDKAELYRRVIFNALISNNDDHPRNHAVIAAGRDWRLAPSYDLTPNPQPGVEERTLALRGARAGWNSARLRAGRTCLPARGIRVSSLEVMTWLIPTGQWPPRSAARIFPDIERRGMTLRVVDLTTSESVHRGSIACVAISERWPTLILPPTKTKSAPRRSSSSES